MSSVKLLKDIPGFKIPSKRYYDDRDWAYEHLNDLAKEYPDLWVAVYKRKVVASGKNLAEVKKFGEEKAKDGQCFYLLTEGRIRWY